MKNYAGNYNRYFNWLPASIVPSATMGDLQYSYPSVAGSFWGSLEVLRAADLLVYAMKNQLTSVKIKIRGYQIAMNFTDRLQEITTNHLYQIDTIFSDKDANEIVITAHQISLEINRNFSPSAFNGGFN